MRAIQQVTTRAVMVCQVLLIILVASTIVKGASPPPGLLERCDSLYVQRANLACVASAVSLLAPYAASEEYHVLWRLARGYYWLGHKSTGADRLRYLEKGKGVAQRATEANGSGAEGFYWYAVCLAEGAREKGIIYVIGSARPLRAALDMALALNPSYSDAHAYLARLYTKAPGRPFSIGDTHKAVYHAQEALKSGACSIGVRRIAAEAYLKAKDVESARVQLGLIVKSPPSAEDPDDDRRHREWAEEELRRLK